LFFQTAFLGDVLLSVPPVYEVLGSQSLVWVVRSGLGGLVKIFFPHAEIFEVKKGQGETYSKIKQQLKSYSWQGAYMAHTSLRSLLWAKSLNFPEVWTYATPLSSFFPYAKVARPRYWPEPLRIYQLFANHPQFHLNLSDSEIVQLSRPSVQGLLPAVSHLFPRFASSYGSPSASRQPRVVFFPGSRWGSKQWPLEYWLHLDQQLTRLGLEAYWLGSQEEGLLWKAYVPEPRNLAGATNWRQTWEFLRDTEWVIAGDTGGGHLAALAGCQLLSLWGPTHLSFGYRPWGDRVWVLERNNLVCRPCHHHGPEKCPLRHHRCMREIPVDEVVSWLKGTLTGRA